MEPENKRLRYDLDEIIVHRKGIVELFTNEQQTQLRELISYCFSLPFKRHRDNYYDRISLLDCTIEIVVSGVNECKNAVRLCHKIQNDLSNDEIRLGWRVSFAAKEDSHRFFYLNDRIRERRSVSFSCRPT